MEKVNSVSNIGKKCSGCSACMNICPKQAISMQEDSEGFLVAVVDSKKCINCGLCLKACPMETHAHKVLPLAGYAAYALDSTTLRKSTSGGIFSIIAHWCLNQDGIVFGCGNIEGLPEHVSAINEAQLDMMRGSKYVQSYMGDIFQTVKNSLNESRLVVFSGTPCQVAGLRGFLQKDYENLICVDIICHGVPSRKLYGEYLNWLGAKYRGKVIDYSFRSKERNDWSLTFAATIQKDNGKAKRIEKIASIDPYYDAFLKGSIYRESCYQCPYSCIERPSDLTLGDFWGIEHVKAEMNNLDGVSAILVSSQKGEKIFSQLKPYMRFEEVSIEDIQKNNGNLRQASTRPKVRDNIYTELQQNGFDYIARKYREPKRYLIESIRNMFSNRFRQKVKNIIKHFNLGKG